MTIYEVSQNIHEGMLFSQHPTSVQTNFELHKFAICAVENTIFLGETNQGF